MKTCAKCGASCPDDMAFCNTCGAKLDEEKTTASETADTTDTMGFMEATKVFFKKYVDFSGRASRAEYWWSFLACCIISFVGGLTIILAPIVGLGLMLPSLAAMVRRLHDMGKSGWWIAFNFVGLGIIPLIMCIMEGEPGANQYGEKPAK